MPFLMCPVPVILQEVLSAEHFFRTVTHITDLFPDLVLEPGFSLLQPVQPVLLPVKALFQFTVFFQIPVSKAVCSSSWFQHVEL